MTRSQEIMTRLILVTIVFLACALLGAVLFLPQEPSLAAETESGADPPAFVHALGRLEPNGTVLSVGVPAGNDASCVAELRVQEGQRVRAQQVLALMDSFAIKAARLQEAEAKVGVARARLRQIEASAKDAELEAARAEIKRLVHRIEATRRTHGRLAILLKEGVVAAEDAGNAASKVAETEQEHRRALASLASLEQVRSVDLDLRRAEVSVAEAALAIARADVDAARVRAPRAGTVLRIHARPGESPGAEGLLELGDISQIQAVAEVFEGDVRRLEKGRPAEVELYSTGEIFTGRVAAVGTIVARKVVLTNDPVSDTDARVVEVRIDLEEEAMETLQRLSNARILVRIEATEVEAVTKHGGRE